MQNQQLPQQPSQSPQQPVPTVVPAKKPNPDFLVAWGPQQNNYHNTRVLCDLSGLTLDEKNDLCGCIFQESRFFNYKPDGTPVKRQNAHSTDWGICQINDNPINKHICAEGCDFPSVDFVMKNPQKVVQYMINMSKIGRLMEWVSYSSGAYLQWLEPNSPMWKLASTPLK